MYIIMFNYTQVAEALFVHCIAQQYTDNVWFYVNSKVQQYTESGVFLCTL
jgi:hypothetical protein